MWSGFFPVRAASQRAQGHFCRRCRYESSLACESFQRTAKPLLVRLSSVGWNCCCMVRLTDYRERAFAARDDNR